MNRIKSLLDSASTVIVIQAENPDGDSLSSSLALEELLGNIGKTVHMFCPVDMPKYLRYLEGWDRVKNQLPKDFDLSIFVDASTEQILERVFIPKRLARLKRKPAIVIDHHSTDVDLPVETINLVYEDSVSTGQIIYELALNQGWQVTPAAGNFIATSILSDSLGLTSSKTSARSIHILAELVDLGVDLSALDNMRRQLNKKSQAIFRYKGQLFERVEFVAEDKIAIVHIPWEDIQNYSDQYNPSMLILDEMRLVEGVKLAAAFKTYPDGKITCKLRANPEAMVADKIAEHFGGGGHPFAAGFKLTDMPYDVLKSEFIKFASEHIEKLDT